MFSTSWIDWGLVAAYFGFLAFIWLRGRGRNPDAAEYLVAGRQVTLPAFVATLVTTWYGGILGIGEYTWRYGISNWLVFGVPYYLGALLFALLFARRARDAAFYTLPDLIAQRAGRWCGVLAALIVFLSATPAAYVLILGTLFAVMTGAPLVWCIVASAALSLFYVDKGGLRTVVLADQVQFVLMFGGFAMLLAFLVATRGGPDLLQATLPPTHFTWHGGNPPQAIFVWYLIALSALVDPAFWQRAYAARDPLVARRGVLWSIVFWIAFDFMTTTCGLYARALLPSLADPVMAFPELGRIVLPPLALGLFYLGMIATVMSTIDGYGFIAATTIGRDFIWRLRGERDESRIPFYSRIGLAVATALAAALALVRGSVVDLWHDIGSVVTPALLIPTTTALYGRGVLGSGWTLAAMALPFLVSLAWVIAKLVVPRAGYPLGIEPIYPGLACSLAIHLAGWSLKKEKT